MPLKGTFPYYSDGVVGESYGAGNYKATNGRLYKVTDDGTAGTPLAWYPAPGHRGHGEGALWYVGSNGYSWSSTSYDSDDHYRGMYLNFNVTELNPSNTTNRANGLQLRCLSVFISPLPFFYPEPRQTRYFAARCLISRFVISRCTSSGDETAR